jgi:hypothetical protein
MAVGSAESLEVVYAVIKPIPVLGALAGDEIIFRPQDPDFPLVLRRAFPREFVSAIPDSAVRMLVAEPTPADSASSAPGRHPGVPAPGSLRLVG